MSTGRLCIVSLLFLCVACISQPAPWTFDSVGSGSDVTTDDGHVEPSDRVEQPGDNTVQSDSSAPEDQAEPTDQDGGVDAEVNPFRWGECGNHKCDDFDGENFLNCPADCLPPPCGNGECEPGENPDNCANDCDNPCGNDLCEKGETPETCPIDCDATCGDQKCEYGEDPEICPDDCKYPCGNELCETGESPLDCPEDCATACGDGECIPPEDANNCPWDCQ
jgi:hypothetical protein